MNASPRGGEEKSVGLIDNYIEQLARTVTKRKESILIDAVEERLGKKLGIHFALDELAGRCEVHILPDGDEIYKLDGKELVIMEKPEIIWSDTKATGNLMISVIIDYHKVGTR